MVNQTGVSMKTIRGIIRYNLSVNTKILNNCVDDIENSIHIMNKAIQNGNKILWCGNGGSAADAQHMAAELVGGLTSHDRKPIPSIALTTDTSFITAWSNDTDYSTIFSRQVEAIGIEGDVLIAISTSGNSLNVIKAIKKAKEMSLKIIILTGLTGGEMKKMGDVMICVPTKDTQRIQEGHLLIEHILCENVESFF